MKILLQALAIGAGITLGLFGLGYLALEAGAPRLSYLFYWQAYVMQMAVPCTLDAAGEYLCLDRGIARIVFWSGIPVGIVVYSLAAGLVLWVLRGRGTPSN